jgi:hypothetical protein
VHLYRFIGGPFDGKSLDYDKLVAVSVPQYLETASGPRVFRLLPTPDDCDRILRGEVALAQLDGPKFPYLYFGLDGTVTQLRDASGGEYLDAVKSHEARRSSKPRVRDEADEECAADESPQSPDRFLAVVVSVAVTSYLSFCCWLPMLLLGPPSAWLWAHGALILIVGFCCAVSARNDRAPIKGLAAGVGFAAFLALSLITVFGPRWPDWRWLIPVLALIPIWAAIAWFGLVLLAWAIYAASYD